MDDEIRENFAIAGRLIQQLAQMQIEHEEANQRAFERFERRVVKLEQLVESNSRAIQALSDRGEN
ncbi:hypothetical protein [Synechococcus sp. PCC 7336]|uniref:hypothetical protein n=1 Tax=Synechococcus sp. PCC 7336 TaxID=195250 RepID=UPI00034A05AE|nr:hypothetical protein [Synechococcus sp. PCC 7336]